MHVLLRYRHVLARNCDHEIYKSLYTPPSGLYYNSVRVAKEVVCNLTQLSIYPPKKILTMQISKKQLILHTFMIFMKCITNFPQFKLNFIEIDTFGTLGIEYRSALQVQEAFSR